MKKEIADEWAAGRIGRCAKGTEGMKRPTFKLTKLSRLQVRMPGKTELESRLVILIKEGDRIEVQRGTETLEGGFCIHRGKLCIRNLDNSDDWAYTPLLPTDKVFLKQRL